MGGGDGGGNGYGDLCWQNVHIHSCSCVCLCVWLTKVPAEFADCVRSCMYIIKQSTLEFPIKYSTVSKTTIFDIHMRMAGHVHIARPHARTKRRGENVNRFRAVAAEAARQTMHDNENVVFGIARYCHSKCVHTAQSHKHTRAQSYPHRHSHGGRQHTHSDAHFKRSACAGIQFNVRAQHSAHVARRRMPQAHAPPAPSPLTAVGRAPAANKLVDPKCTHTHTRAPIMRVRCTGCTDVRWDGRT